MNKKTIFWIIGGIGFSCLLCSVVLFVALVFFNQSNVIEIETESKNIIIEIDVPKKVKKGEDFLITVKITNTDNKSQVLDSIDFETTYLDGISILSSEPESLSFREFSFGQTYRTYDFQYTIPENETILIVFSLNGPNSGDYSGEFYICLNSEILCDLYDITTKVQ